MPAPGHDCCVLSLKLTALGRFFIAWRESMTLAEIRASAIAPALELLPAQMTSPEAVVMLLAIGLQESRFQHRRQLVGRPPRPAGPATGFWQFERGGGVTGVLSHRASRDHAHALCRSRDVIAAPAEVWVALQHDDVLAAGFARLLLWTDPHRLPPLGDAQAAWDLY